MDSDVDFENKTRKYRAIAAVKRLNKQLHPDQTDSSYNEENSMVNESEADDPSYEALNLH